MQTSKDVLYKMELKEEKVNTYVFNFKCKFNKEVIEREYVVEKTYFKPFLMGRDVHRFDSLETNRFVFFPYDIIEGKSIVVDINKFESDFPLTYEYIKDKSPMRKK